MVGSGLLELSGKTPKGNRPRKSPWPLRAKGRAGQGRSDPSYRPSIRRSRRHRMVDDHDDKSQDSCGENGLTIPQECS